MTVENLIETVKKHESAYRLEKELQNMMESYAELVKEGYTNPRGYALQSFDDKHKENVKHRIKVIKT